MEVILTKAGSITLGNRITKMVDSIAGTISRQYSNGASAYEESALRGDGKSALKLALFYLAVKDDSDKNLY